jgi:hypothetical protein
VYLDAQLVRHGESGLDGYPSAAQAAMRERVRNPTGSINGTHVSLQGTSAARPASMGPAWPVMPATLQLDFSDAGPRLGFGTDNVVAVKGTWTIGTAGAPWPQGQSGTLTGTQGRATDSC